MKAISSLGVIPALSYSGLSRGIVDGGHEGPLLLQIHAEGGWDVTSYCDPKVNQPGERPITTWSETLDPVRVGGIEFAPFANNEWFVEKYHQQMLVINGVDLQTNSHTTGILHNWSGRNAAGYPALTALFAAHYAPTAPMASLFCKNPMAILESIAKILVLFQKSNVENCDFNRIKLPCIFL